MQQLALDFWPKSRHTGEAWASTGKARAKSGGQELTYHAALLQGRRNWAFYNSVHDFPQMVKHTHMLEVQGSKGGAFLTTRKLALRQLGEARGWRGMPYWRSKGLLALFLPQSSQHLASK